MTIPVLAITNKAAIVICVRVFVQMQIFFSLEYISRTRMTGLHDRGLFY